MAIPYRLPTAKDYRASVAAHHRRLEEKNRDPTFQTVLAAARAEAAGVARLLRSEFGATRVRLFGSLARGDADDDFDIDLAVEGIAPERFFAAYAAASRRATRKLDLIDLEDAPALLRARVEEDGVDLP